MEYRLYVTIFSFAVTICYSLRFKDFVCAVFPLFLNGTQVTGQKLIVTVVFAWLVRQCACVLNVGCLFSVIVGTKRFVAIYIGCSGDNLHIR